MIVALKLKLALAAASRPPRGQAGPLGCPRGPRQQHSAAALVFGSRRAFSPHKERRGGEWRVSSLRWPRGLRTADVAEVSRWDIASYLGLTKETVSLTLTYLETNAAIALATSRRIELCNRETLLSLNF
jgi:Crp-like helix-turn-helix domain